MAITLVPHTSSGGVINLCVGELGNCTLLRYHYVKAVRVAMRIRGAVINLCPSERNWSLRRAPSPPNWVCTLNKLGDGNFGV